MPWTSGGTRVRSDRATAAWSAAALALAVVAVYARTLHHEFVRYDDFDYVVHNPIVGRGLTLDGLRWAFTTAHAANWHPLTWISHMLDVTLFGLTPGGHHLVSVLLHAANATLLFLVLRAMTRRTLLSAFVSTAFALHPLRVESVAWVAERKDLLAGLFWILTVAAWTGWVRRPSTARYAAVLAALAAGLMAKPMLVTLPLVLGLLDLWPLERWREVRPAKLLLEKLPLVAVCAASAVVTVVAQRAGGAVARLDDIPFPSRILNALVAYGAYVSKTIWPAGLSVNYPHFALVHPETPNAGLWLPALASGAAIAAVTAIALIVRRRHPYLIVGWLWYLIALLPVIGLVQVGNQSMADRYAYLPSIGLFLAVVWGLASVVRRTQALHVPVLALAAVALTAWALSSWRQVGHWRDSRALFERAIAVTRDNYVAHNNLGNVLADAGDLAGAAAQYEAALAVHPGFAEALNGLGTVRAAAKDDSGAVPIYERALALRPDYVEAHYNLAVSLERLRRTDEAMRHYRLALQHRPGLAVARERLAALERDRAGGP